MWIKKIKNSLYLSIVLRMTLSALLSILLLLGLIKLSNYYVESQNLIFTETQEVEVNAIVSDIQSMVTSQELTFQQAKRSNLGKNTGYEIEWLGTTNALLDEIEQYDDLRFSDKGHIFKIVCEDADGFIIIKSNKAQLTSNIFYLSSAIVSIISFFTLSIYLIFKQLSYIWAIEKGIDYIASDDILYKIPIKGKNELARLAHRINHMGDTLHSKIQKEREYEINQRMLITNMAHDLKTPLTSMTGYVDIMKNKLSAKDELYEYATIAMENGNRLEKLINDLFLYSKLISGDIPVDIQKININTMLKQIVEIRTENVIYEEKEQDLVADIDADKFHRVIDNLISNAKKYGIQDKPICLSVDLQNDEIVVCTQNHTADNLDGKIDLLKNRLYTAREDRPNGSSGLGLSIVMELLKTMNGTLELTYDDSIFTAIIKLPKA